MKRKMGLTEEIQFCKHRNELTHRKKRNFNSEMLTFLYTGLKSQKLC